MVHEPSHLAVTGFRDPTVTSWPALDEVRSESSRMYGVLSGGLQHRDGADHDVGPCIFLYDIDPQDHTRWTFLRTLFQVPRNLRLNPSKWGAIDYGTNWECASVFTLSAQGESRDVCIFGVEGGSPAPHVVEYMRTNPGRRIRDVRYCPWHFVEKSSFTNKTWTPKTAGLVDWAEFYAVSTFLHPDGRRIAWGWFVDLDLGPELARAKGWTGCLGLPRELDLKVYDGVVGTILEGGSTLDDISSFEVVHRDGGARIVTLGVQPLAELDQLRLKVTDLKPDKAFAAPACYEIDLIAEFSDAIDAFVTLEIRHSNDRSTSSSITFRPAGEQIIISRGQSVSSSHSQESEICTQDEAAPFTLLRYQSCIEKLHWRVYVDVDTLEVFCNSRVAFATRLYSPNEANLVTLRVSDNVQVESAKLWEMDSIGLIP